MESVLDDIIDKSGLGKIGGAGGDADEDDVPPLVDGNFESAAKWNAEQKK